MVVPGRTRPVSRVRIAHRLFGPQLDGLHFRSEVIFRPCPSGDDLLAVACEWTLSKALIARAEREHRLDEAILTRRRRQLRLLGRHLERALTACEPSAAVGLAVVEEVRRVEGGGA